MLLTRQVSRLRAGAIKAAHLLPVRATARWLKAARARRVTEHLVLCDQGIDRHQGISFIHGGEDVKNVGLDAKIRVGAGALALTLVLAGCATGPAYVRPSVDVPGAFKERPAAVPAPGWKPASP